MKKIKQIIGDEELVHWVSPDEEYALCGVWLFQLDISEKLDGDVTCPGCKRIVDHVKKHFVPSFADLLGVQRVEE